MIIIQDLIKLQVNSTFNIENLKIWSMVICIVYVEARWTMDHGPWCFPYVGTPSLYPPKKKKKKKDDESHYIMGGADLYEKRRLVKTIIN